jgi:sugar lactone lactonase YvrE
MTKMNTRKTTKKMQRSVFPVSVRLTLASLVAAMIVCPTAGWSQTGEWTVHNTTNSGLPYNGITDLALDAQGTIWVGTGRWWAHAGGGLAKFDGTNWTVYNTGNSGLPDNDHVSLSIDDLGNVWSGTEGGLSKFDGTNWTVYLTHNSGLLSNRAGAPAFDAAGNAWIATFPDGGLARFDGENWTVYKTHNSGLPNNFITDVAVDVHGNIWAGTFGSGVVKFDGTSWSVYNTGNSGLPHNDTSFLATDDEGSLWIGTYGGGLGKFDGASWTSYNTVTSGLPDNWIWNLNVDPRGDVWAGTKAGLARFDGANWTVYDKSNSGLPDNNVYCIAFDIQGDILIGTESGGLAVYRPQPTIDFNGDGTVEMKDLLRLIQSWDQDDPTVDIAPLPFGDGIVDALDLELLMSCWRQEVEDPTLVAHWPLDETEGAAALDIAGDNIGFVMGNPVWQADAGQVNGAIQLDGVDDTIIAGPPLNPADGPFSLFIWVKGGAAGQAIISEPAGPNWLSLDPLTGHLMTELTSAGRGATPLQSQAVITDENWHRIGFVWDGLHRTLYSDGIAVAEDTQDGLSNAGNGFYVGTGKAMAPGTYFSGLIDDVRIYNRAVRP